MDCREPTRLLCAWDSLGKNTGVGCHALLQGIFLTKRLDLCLLHFLLWRCILYHWSTGEALKLRDILYPKIISLNTRWYLGQRPWNTGSRAALSSVSCSHWTWFCKGRWGRVTCPVLTLLNFPLVFFLLPPFPLALFLSPFHLSPFLLSQCSRQCNLVVKCVRYWCINLNLTTVTYGRA